MMDITWNFAEHSPLPYAFTAGRYLGRICRDLTGTFVGERFKPIAPCVVITDNYATVAEAMAAFERAIKDHARINND